MIAQARSVSSRTGERRHPAHTQAAPMFLIFPGCMHVPLPQSGDNFAISN